MTPNALSASCDDAIAKKAAEAKDNADDTNMA
jgi:hypothetical protein